MEINTKCNVGDFVYLLGNCCIKRVMVIDIRISVKDINKRNIQYNLTGYPDYVDEDDIFVSKEEAVQYLKDNIVEEY